MFHDYYEILEIEPEATLDEIKRAYRNRAREAHPDRHPDSPETQTEEMSLINEAYTVLKDPRKRASYDVSWRKYYRIKGLTRKAGGDLKTLEKEWRTILDEPDDESGAVVGPSIPFWKRTRFLVAILVVLLVVLGIDIYITFYRGKTIGTGVVRDISLGYEFALGRGFRESASDRHFQRARQDQGLSVDETIWQLNRALRLNPDNLQAGLDMARLLIDTERYEDALAACRHGLGVIEERLGNHSDEAVTITLNNIRADYMDAAYRAHIKLGQYEPALEYLFELTELFPENLRYLLDLAITNLELGLYDNARDHAESILEGNPDEAFRLEAATMIARSYLNEWNFSLAFDKAVEGLGTAPDDPGLNLIAGRASYNLGNFEQAVPYLGKAIALQAGNHETHFMLGIAYLNTGQPGLAVEQFTIVLRSGELEFETNMALGNAYYELGDYDEAGNHYFRAIEIRPDNQSARNALDRLPSSD